jgi:hypothetical protein
VRKRKVDVIMLRIAKVGEAAVQLEEWFTEVVMRNLHVLKGTVTEACSDRF